MPTVVLSTQLTEVRGFSDFYSEFYVVRTPAPSMSALMCCTPVGAQQCLRLAAAACGLQLHLLLLEQLRLLGGAAICRQELLAGGWHRSA